MSHHRVVRFAHLLLLVIACTDKQKPPAFMTRDQLLDPQTCAMCHPTQYQEWSGSMHAYAADDPIFLAMNKRGQRETNGMLGSFCVKCHAPMALADKLTTDGLNLVTIPAKYKGVTCFFCHTADAVTGTHDAALHLTTDTTMRGEYKDPIATNGHPSVYSAMHDKEQSDSAGLCGACHDIVTPHGAELERTFKEWQGSVFSTPAGATCASCHMNQSTSDVPIANVPNAPKRRVHSHRQSGVDLALTDFPEKDIQKQKVLDLLSTTLQTALCVKQIGAQAELRVLLDNVGAGHAFPSGSAQDRRVFVEVIATQNGMPVYQSGVVADGARPTDAMTDPDRWLVRDCIFDDAQKEVNMFWQAASFESISIPAQLTFDMLDPRFYKSHLYWRFPVSGMLFMGQPDRVTMRVRIQPIGLDVLDDLIASGDLDMSLRAQMQTLDVGALLEWTPAKATKKFFDSDNLVVACSSDTNFNVSADKFAAPAHTKCSP